MYLKIDAFINSFIWKRKWKKFKELTKRFALIYSKLLYKGYLVKWIGNSFYGGSFKTTLIKQYEKVNYVTFLVRLCDLASPLVLIFEVWGNQMLCIALLCRFSNCKLVVQSKVGLQRLARVGYSNFHRWDVVFGYIYEIQTIFAL